MNESGLETKSFNGGVNNLSPEAACRASSRPDFVREEWLAERTTHEFREHPDWSHTVVMSSVSEQLRRPRDCAIALY
jgi:hypothetical protein